MVLPFFDLLPAPGRHGFLAYSSMIMLLSFLLMDFVSKTQSKRVYLLFSLIALIFLVDIFPMYYESYWNLKVPDIVFSMADSDEDFKVLNMAYGENTQGMYLQTVHKKKSMDGFVSRTGPDSKNDLISITVYLKEKRIDMIERVLSKNDVKYIIFNDYYYGPGGYKSSKDFKLLNSSLKMVDSSPGLGVYEYIYKK
jgi:hypothetical protein